MTLDQIRQELQAAHELYVESGHTDPDLWPKADRDGVFTLAGVEALIDAVEAADMRSLRENQCVVCTGHPYGTHYEDCPLGVLTPL